MKHYVIIGNSATGIAAAEAVRERDKESRLTILTDEPGFAYRRPDLVKFLEAKAKERDLSYRKDSFYADNAINLLTETPVAELALHRKHLTLKDKKTIDFDGLLIATGRRFSRPSIKGVQKEGVVTPTTLRETKFILENLPIAHTVLIVGPGPVAEAIARAAASRRIEVKFFGALGTPIEGVETIRDHQILEILGESDVRAVRLTNQKVLGASLIIFAASTEPNLELVKGTDLVVERGIAVDEGMHTNIPGIFAAGGCAQVAGADPVEDWEAAAAQGRVAGENLCRI